MSLTCVILAKRAFCQADIHYFRETKPYVRGEVMSFVEPFSNLYGNYIRIKDKNHKHSDILLDVIAVVDYMLKSNEQHIAYVKHPTEQELDDGEYLPVVMVETHVLDGVGTVEKRKVHSLSKKNALKILADKAETEAKLGVTITLTVESNVREIKYSVTDIPIIAVLEVNPTKASKTPCFKLVTIGKPTGARGKDIAILGTHDPDYKPLEAVDGKPITEVNGIFCNRRIGKYYIY